MTMPKTITRSDIVNKGLSDQLRVSAWLRSHGLIATAVKSYLAKWDLECKGKRIEVKSGGALQIVSSSGSFQTRWQFNIHRHGVLDESQVDVYILRLEDVPEFTSAIHLIVPAPIGREVVKISLRSLITQWAVYFNRVDLIDSSIKPPRAVELYGSPDSG